MIVSNTIRKNGDAIPILEIVRKTSIAQQLCESNCFDPIPLIGDSSKVTIGSETKP